ncbi:restriction endonuclease subunit S [Mycoplasmopsis cynos]|nr:restriction endonuclease subunit S [Mycoplasmopsis felis]WQQ11678.1 restriction endonuclease subunit S [Mycoplasmopsis felis]
MKKVLVPRVRFKGFDDNWEQGNIGEVFELTRGEVLSQRKIRNKKMGEYIYPVFSSQTLNNGLLGFYNNFLFKNSITWTTDGANAGTVLYRDGLFYATNVCGVMLQKTSIKPSSYFAHEINVKVKKHVIKAGNPKLMINVLHEVLINFSKNKLEQEKISILIENIDNLITLEQTKLNKLKQLKETLLQKMFPEGNSKIPRIRFKGFDEEWKEYKFNDIGSYYSTSSLSYNDLSKGGQYKCVLYGELYTKYNERIFNVISRTNKKITLTQPNDILFPTSTTVDPYSLISPSCVNEENVMTGGDLFGIRPYKNINGNFISYYINNVEYIKNKLANKAQGLTIIHLYYKNILNENLYIASLEEQNKIAKLFVKIDTIINLYQSKLNKLKQIKEALLQKMFV